MPQDLEKVALQAFPHGVHLSWSEVRGQIDWRGEEKITKKTNISESDLYFKGS